MKGRDRLESGGLLGCTLMWIEGLVLCLTEGPVVPTVTARQMNVECYGLNLTRKTEVTKGRFSLPLCPLVNQ